MNLLIGVGGQFIGLLIEPDAIQPKPAADANDVFAELEIRCLCRQQPGRQASCFFSTYGNAASVTPGRSFQTTTDEAADSDCTLSAQLIVVRIAILQKRQNIAMKEQTPAAES